MTKEQFIDKHGSGTLRKNTRLGMKTNSQYLEERIAWEFGWEFRAEYASRVLIGECISEGDVKGYTELGWYADRYIARKPFPEDKVIVAYIRFETEQGEVITAIVRLEDGTVFTYIPFHKLTTKTEGVNFEVSFEEVHFHNSPDFEISVNYMVNLAGYKVQVFNKFRGEWENDCRYHFTVDYVNDNMCLSLIEKTN